MPEDYSDLREVNYRRLFPWTELFRAFRIALDLRKLALAGAGVLLTLAVWRLVALPFESAPSGADAAAAEADAVATRPFREGITGELAGQLGGLVNPERPGQIELRRFPHVVSRPFQLLTQPFARLFRTADWSWAGFVLSLIDGLLAVLIWAFFGGAVTRLAAVQVARDERIGLSDGLRFACSRYLSFVGGPLFPFVGVLVFLVLCLAGGLVAQIPWLGDLFAGVLWVLPLLAGFVMAIILVGVAVGWPLMFATVSAEGSDSFDALSRSYSYVYQRPWHYGFYWVIALIYGTIVTAFVVLFATLLVYLSGWAVSWGARQATVATFFAYAPAGWNTLFGPAPEEITFIESIGAWLVAVWLYALFVLMLGFVYSYFWTASTIIYFLLRRNVDATELDEVYLEDEEQEEFGMSPEPESEPPLVESATASEDANAAAADAPETPTPAPESQGEGEEAEEPAEQDPDDPDAHRSE